jgi:hypothetical protein
MVKVLENAWNVLMDSTRVKRNKPFACRVKMASYRMKKELPVKSHHGKSRPTATKTYNTSTIPV